MKNTSISALKLAGAGALALLLAASAFAEGRPQDRTWRDGDRRDTYRERRDDHSRDRSSDSYRRYRENERVQMHGRIRSYSRDRGGYRVWMDGGPHAFWVPESSWRRDWRVGVMITLGGIFRGGTIYADRYDDRYDDGRYYDDRYRDRYAGDYVRGYVERVDYRSEVIVLRESRSGRRIRVDMDRADRGRSRLDLRDVRRGDTVTLVGRWTRGDIFYASGIDSIDSGRY